MTPENIEFTDLTIPRRDLEPELRGPMNLAWTRVKFAVPDGHDAPKAVEAWLGRNCLGRHQNYHYRDPKESNGYLMVVRFEDKNDALMFKLRGGHQAWEQSREY